MSTWLEKQILNGIRGQLDKALKILPPDEPADEDHARGWIEQAAAQVDKLLE